MLKKNLAISIALTIPLLFLSISHTFPAQFGSFLPEDISLYSNYVMLALATPVQFWIGWRLYRGSWNALKKRVFNPDILIAIGTTTSYAYSAIITIIPSHFPSERVYFVLAAVIITLILTGRFLEIRIKKMKQLSYSLNDRSRRKEFVLTVDPPLLRTKNTTDQKFEYFIPLVLGIAIGVGFGWYFIGNIGVTFSLLAFISITIIASPRALALAKPAALVAGANKGNQYGISLNGLDRLKILKPRIIVFYGKRMLTNCKQSVIEIVDWSGIGKDELLRLAAIAESLSKHPISQAVVSCAKKSGIQVPSPNSCETIAGHGVKSVYFRSRNQRHSIIVGNRKLMKDNNITVTEAAEKTCLDRESQGKTATLVAVDNKLAGVIFLEDSLKENAKKTIEILNKSKGIETLMLTGDSITTAKAVASKLGIARVIAQVLVHEKAQIISKLKEKENKMVVVVDNENNAAPELTRADVEMVLGARNNISIDSRKIIIRNDDLRCVVTAMELREKTLSKMKKNLLLAYAYNIVLVAIASGIIVPFSGLKIFEWLPMLAALAMTISSLAVLGNSILLERYKSNLCPKI